jgi:hypothetical protein
MTCEVHEFDPVEGGRVRVSLTYAAQDRSGKTEGRTVRETGFTGGPSGKPALIRAEHPRVSEFASTRRLLWPAP